MTDSDLNIPPSFEDCRFSSAGPSVVLPSGFSESIAWKPRVSGWIAGRFDASTVHADVTALQHQLVQMGIPKALSSRLQEYKRELDAAKRDGGYVLHGRNVSILHRAFADVPQLSLIARSLGAPPEVSGWRERFITALSGSVMPERDAPESPGRDAQFELFVAALLRASGQRVQLAEPDVVVEHPRGELSIAAKRLKSANKLEARLRKARDQIAASGRDGIVALDISPSADTGGMVRSLGVDYAFAQSGGATVRLFIGQNREKIYRSLSRSPALGVWVWGLFPNMGEDSMPSGMALGSELGWVCADDDPRLRIVLDLYRWLLEGARQCFTDRKVLP